MKRILITLACTLALTACGKSDKPAFQQATHLCREQGGRVINAFDKKECENYWGGTWEKTKPAG